MTEKREKMKTIARRSKGVWLKGIFLALVGLFVLFLLAGQLMRPDLSVRPVEYPAEVIRAAQLVRETRMDIANPPRVQVDVDYSEGEVASWWPKGESPILTTLVQEGKLLPVAERVGSEPLVLEGPDGIGKYGGTWFQITCVDSDIYSMETRFSGATLFRWSPQGFPMVPHLAKGYEVSDDGKEYIIYLRKGVRWSDGHPFTAEDILYWWKYEINDPVLKVPPPAFMLVQGEKGNVEMLDKYRVKFTFPHPNGMFIPTLCSEGDLVSRPAHYLRKYHPTLGDKEFLEECMRLFNVAQPSSVYSEIKQTTNPEHPRLWPWVYRKFRTNPPTQFVRNPYYWAVDTKGNQLPYIDMIYRERKDLRMVTVAAAAGEVSCQSKYINFTDYTMLMDKQKDFAYRVYHWAGGSGITLYPNINRRIEKGKPETKWKSQLLADKRFRHALSLSIDRDQIIRGEYNNIPKASQASPAEYSRFFRKKFANAFVEYDLKKANTLLDELGLTARDIDGYRTFPDGTPMMFMLDYRGATYSGIAQFLVNDWAKIGVRMIPRERSGALFNSEKAFCKQDITIGSGGGEIYPMISPSQVLPTWGCNFAPGFSKWYIAVRNPDRNKDKPVTVGVEPPLDHPLRRGMEIYNKAGMEVDIDRQAEIFQEVLDIAAENIWTIGVSTGVPVLGVVKDGFKNVPPNGVSNWTFRTPSNFGLETFFFEKPYNSPGTIAQIQHDIMTPTLQESVSEAREDAEKENTGAQSGVKVSKLIRWCFILIGLALLVMIVLRHPFVLRRLFLMVPMALMVSVIVFVVIQLPPEDYLSTYIAQIEESGDKADLEHVREVKEMFHLEEPMPVQYAYWLGLKWFVTFDEKDTGLLQGNMGRSMQSLKPVNDIIGDRILLTFLITLGTVIFTWATAIPIGIYSAVRQYSLGDYIFMFLGFIGMCIPGFLLALLLMYVSAEWFDVPVTGLFSSEYGAQPEWGWLKVLDLLKHIWVPIVVVGVGGTAGMIRVMRANLLDELKKPYVVTARAKGVPPIKLLFKYPVRLALNPFISGIGGLLPHLISGSAIVAMILSLPTVGPLMLNALLSEDMYMAGSMLMVFSILGMLGTLISDLLLLWLDPRIRLEGGTR